VDPITVQVIQANLVSIVDEMEANMTRTAYSPIVYEVKDLCAALLDTDFRIIAQARGGMPIFLADMGAPVKAAMDNFADEGIAPGDVVVTNAPAASGQHLNNVVVFSAVFASGQHVGYAAVRAHWSDVGGSVPGSFSTVSADIYAEGLILDSIKLIRGGVEDPEIRRLIEANIRYPTDTFGDFRAQVAACRIGERRLAELSNRYGADDVLAAVTEIWQRSEDNARRRLAATPDGVYEAHTFLDDDGRSSDPVDVNVRITIAGDSMSIDLSECSPQVAGNINCGESAAFAAVRVAFKMFTSPATSADEGSFRPLTMILPPGRFISARPPAAMHQWSAVQPLLIDTVLLALNAADPSRVPAGHHGSVSPYIWVGRTREGREFVHVDTCCGGWGAAFEHDGGSGLKSYQHGDTYTVACEIEEAMYPLRIEHYRFETDTGGPGRWRGGPATAKAYRTLHDLHVTFAFERERCPPWGKDGGEPGTHNHLRLYDDAGQIVQRFAKHTLLPCPEGTVVEMVSGSGGGCGRPEDRDPARVAADVRDGYVSPAAARSVFRALAADPAEGESPGASWPAAAS
jgi:N-methylhydantoinase B